jgi:ribosomal protein L21
MSRRHDNPWIALGADMARLSVESSSVIGLRMMQAAMGSPAAQKEAVLMVSEKAKAAIDAQILLARSVMAGEGHLGPSRAVALYRRRVRANHRRLTRKS